MPVATTPIPTPAPTPTPVTTVKPAVVSATPATNSYLNAKADYTTNIAPKVAPQVTPQTTPTSTPDTSADDLKTSIKNLNDIVSALGTDDGSSNTDTTTKAPDLSATFVLPTSTPSAGNSAAIYTKDGSGGVSGNGLVAYQNSDGTYTDAATGAKITDPTQASTYKAPAGDNTSSTTSTDNVGDAIQKNLQAETDAYNDYKVTLAGIANGNLSPAQNSQIQSMVDTMNGLIAQQVTANKNYTNAISILGSERGNAMYEPEVQAGNIYNAVTAGAAKIQDIQSKARAAISKMETAFQTDNYKAAQDAYTSYNKLLTDQATELNNIQKSITTHAENVAKDNLNRIKAATTAVVNSAKLTLSQKTTAIKQSTLDEKSKNDAIKAAQAWEKISVTKQKNAFDAYLKAHPEAKESVVDTTLSSAYAAIAAGADPKAVRARFLQAFPDSSTVFDNYTTQKTTSTKKDTSTSSSTPSGADLFGQ